MEQDIETLLGYRQAPPAAKKSSSAARIDTLIDKGVVSSGKINSLKIKQKAREMQEVRSIPTINEKSRRLAENLKRERMDVIAKYEAKSNAISEPPPPPPEPVRISVNIIKQLDLSEAPPSKPDVKNMNVHERSKYWKEQKEKKLEEQRKAKKDKELDGCTFKPKKIDIQDFEISSKPVKENTISRVKSADSKAPIKVVSQEPEQSLAFLLKGVGNDKAPQTLKPAPGFLSGLSKPLRK